LVTGVVRTGDHRHGIGGEKSGNDLKDAGGAPYRASASELSRA
jgi:hypothetical protein